MYDLELHEGSFEALSITYPLHEVNDLLLAGVAGQEVVDVLDDVHADVADQVPRLLGGGPGRGGEAEHGEGELVHGGGHGVQLRRGDVPWRGGARLLYAVLTSLSELGAVQGACKLRHLHFYVNLRLGNPIH